MSPIGIDPAPTPANSVILLHPDDSVVVARVPLSPSQPITVNSESITPRAPIPAGHKLARRPIPAGQNVIRYGQVIGRASTNIAPGDHVHIHNLLYEEGARDYHFPTSEIDFPAPPANMPTWWGYPRPDGRAGTRNYIVVAAASNCASHTAQLVADHFAHTPLPPNVDGVVAFTHADGCGHSIGPDTEQLERVMRGLIHHPNVAGAIILGLGCEINLVEHYSDVQGFTLQASGGTPATVEAGINAVHAEIERAASLRRVETPASKIILGLNCGGSDSFSGITANPALGHCSDSLAALGASAVLAETPEIFGAEHLLVRRARSRHVAEKLLAVVSSYKTYLRRFDASFDDNPSPGNKEGGLSNILEKSLGAVAKGGTSPLMDVFEYGQQVTTPGFVFMNTPGYDPVSLAGLGAGGANLIAFTTGRGSAIGFPTIPVLKIASNSPMFRRMTSNMDLNAGRIADGSATVSQIGQEIFNLLLEVASGRPTLSERWGHREFVPWRIGPVM